ncbi:MAG TPA: LemA family protein [Thermoanaerobaculia bacterium]|jgi:LemA protein|nr:LemA family protein [Thermoanaerobaculia bacterium]
MGAIGGCLAFLVLIAVFAAIWAIWRYNNLISLKYQVANAWKQIDVQLKRRHDLIPNLIASVRGEMQFEQDTLEKVIAARNSAVAARGVAETAEKENALTQTLSRLFALAENYPNLKANESVRTLMEELTSTENKIGFARQYYNDVATRFNTAQQVFPDSLIAQAFKFQPVELFEITEPAEREVPKVDLNIRPQGPGVQGPGG